MFHHREEGEARKDRKRRCVKKRVEERTGRERKQRDGKEAIQEGREGVEEEEYKGGSGWCLVPHMSKYDIVVFSCTVGNV